MTDIGDYARSRERVLKDEERREGELTFAGSLRGRALMHGKFLVPLTNLIGADRCNGERDIEVWKALKNIRGSFTPPEGQDSTDSEWVRDYHTAWRVLFAGIAVGYSNVDADRDKDDEKSPIDQAIWIGRAVIGEDGEEEATEKEQHYRVGSWGVRLLLRLGIFKTDADDLLVLDVTPEMRDLWNEVIEFAIAGNPLLSPMSEPPLPWTQTREGVIPRDEFWYWARPRLVYRNEKEIREAIGAGRMQQALSAINSLQAVPCVINRPVLDWTFKYQVPKVKAKRIIFNTDMSIARGIAIFNRFFVPLKMDMRARLYGICHFCYQREDHVRGLFLFADGDVIGDDGLQELKSHVAAKADGNTWSGIKKPSKLNRKDRIAWTERNLVKLLEIGEAVALCKPVKK
jgi:hypothetical protein